MNARTISAVVSMTAMFGVWTHAGVVSVDVITRAGDMPPGGGGSAVSTLNAPFTNADGKVGFTGNLTPSNNFVWYDTDIIWLNSDGAPDALTGAEGTMGVSNTGNFIYSPSTNGNDSVWTGAGVLLQGTDVAPDFPAQFNTFNSRPIMLPDGSAVWMAGLANVSGGASVNRVCYRSTPAGAISKVFAGGDVIDGFTLNTTSSNFTFWVSDNGLHHIHEVVSTDVSTANDFLYVDGSMMYREGNPTGSGANWQVFDTVSINNSGNHVFSGDDSGATTADEFIAYNGTIVLREGDVVDGVTWLSGWGVTGLSINNLNRVVFIIGSGAAEHLFEGDGTNLAATAKLILSNGDNVDTDGDFIADATITDFEASPTIGPGLDLSDHRHVYMEVTLLDLDTQVSGEAIIRVELPDIGSPCPGDIAPPGGDGSVGVADLLLVVNSWGLCAGCPADLVVDGTVGVADLLFIINNWGPCN